MTNYKQPALAISQLRKTYGVNFDALKGIDLLVEAGDFFALLGPNGAGKSTTIGIICSLVRKTSGSLSVFGCDIDTDFANAKKHIGVVPQEFNFHQFEKPFHILVTQAGYYGIPRRIAEVRAEKFLSEFGLWNHRFETARNLSGGMKRRLMIARALIHDPQLLVLDEPTAGVDIELRRAMWDFLREINRQGKTIILTTHYLEEAENLCKNVAIIDQGHIIQNTSIKSLIKQLNRETFLLDTREEVTMLPKVAGYPIALADSHCIEVEVKRGQTINPLFIELERQSIDVLSMRNKTNRLEELFVNMVEKQLKKGQE